LQEFALVFALAQRAWGRAAPQHSARIYKENFAGVVKKQRQNLPVVKKQRQNLPYGFTLLGKVPMLYFCKTLDTRPKIMV